MLKRIGIHNFRGFRSVQIDLAAVTVLLGPNSSGKTSILHAIRVACAAINMALADEATVVGDGWIALCKGLAISDHEELMSVARSQELFTDCDTRKPIRIALDFDRDQAIQAANVQLSYGHNDVLKLDAYVQCPQALDGLTGTAKRTKKLVSERLRNLIKDQIPIALFVPQFYGVTVAEPYLTGARINRLLKGGEQSRLVRNLVARLTGQELAALNKFLQISVGAQLTERTLAQDAEATEFLQVFFKDTNGGLELASAGSGLVGLIALYASIERYRAERARNRSVLFLLDEPEAHLHPRLQGEIGRALADLVTEFGAQLLIATHSIEMINRLGQRADSRLISVNRAESRAVALTSHTDLLRELGAFCDLTPFSAINFLASGRILFHEGPSDATILLRCAEIYFRNDPLRLARFREWTLVSLDGVHNAGGADILQRLLTPELFPELWGERTVRVIRIRDRDGKRSPGWGPPSKKGRVEVQDIVWSRYSIESLFLDASCLAEWLAPGLQSAGLGTQELRPIIENALRAAKDSRALDDAAIDALIPGIQNQGKPAQEARELARTTARENPEVWQPGKRRAAYVLEQIREELKKQNLSQTLYREVPGNVVQLVQQSDARQIGDLAAAIPSEIRAILDAMG